MHKLLLLILISFCSLSQLKATSADLFFFDESYVAVAFSELTELENKLEENHFDFSTIETYKHLNLFLLSPDNDTKTAGDSFFKGFTLGCLGVMDAYLEDDRNKYKRGPLWTGCCLNTIILGGLYYLLDTNYFHLIPGS